MTLAQLAEALALRHQGATLHDIRTRLRLACSIATLWRKLVAAGSPMRKGMGRQKRPKVPKHDAPLRDTTDRDRRIIQLLMLGQRQAVVAKKFGLTRQRVHQLLKAHLDKPEE